MSLNPLKRVKFISIYPECVDAKSNLSLSQSPQTGQVYFNFWRSLVLLDLKSVSIPSNGSSLFQLKEWCKNFPISERSQSPQTGQVYFNPRNFWRSLVLLDLKVSIPSNGSSLFQLCATIRLYRTTSRKGLNPLKRVKFISIQTKMLGWTNVIPKSLNPLKRVKFISIVFASWAASLQLYASLNPLKRVKFISIWWV